MGVIAKFKVIISKHEKQKFMTQYGNRELISLIECVFFGWACLKSIGYFQGKGDPEVLEEDFQA